MSSIWVVENDEAYVDLICRKLTREFDFATEVIRTEAEFRGRLAQVTGSWEVMLIIQDIAMPWTRRGPTYQPPPPEIRNEGVRALARAGYRCVELALRNPFTQDTPIILYTQYEQERVAPELARLPEHVCYVRKESGQQALVDKAVELLRR